MRSAWLPVAMIWPCKINETHRPRKEPRRYHYDEVQVLFVGAILPPHIPESLLDLHTSYSPCDALVGVNNRFTSALSSSDCSGDLGLQTSLQPELSESAFSTKRRLREQSSRTGPRDVMIRKKGKATFSILGNDYRFECRAKGCDLAELSMIPFPKNSNPDIDGLNELQKGNNLSELPNFCLKRTLGPRQPWPSTLSVSIAFERSSDLRAGSGV